MSDFTAAAAAAAADRAASHAGIPLDLAPLLTPYGHLRRLSLRVVHLPPQACFSQGVGNEDASWSLAQGDLEGLELLLPEGAAPPLTLAIRLVGIDKDENATVVGQFDVPLFSITTASRAAGGPLPAPPAPAAWQARMERRVAAALRLSARKARLGLVEAKRQWQAESDQRVAEQAAALEEEWRRKVQAERAARRDAEARAGESARNLTELSGELDAARTRAAAAEAAKRQLDESASEVLRLEMRLAEAEARWQAETRERLTAQAAELEREWQQGILAERAARDDAAARAAAAVREATALASEIAALRENAAAAEPESGPRCAPQADEARLAATVKQALEEAEAASAAQLEAARESWHSEAQTALATAEARWRAAEAKRFATARAEWQKTASATAGRSRRALRSVARKQGFGDAGRRFTRLSLIAGCAAAGLLLYSEFKPTIIQHWVPKGLALASDVEATALSRLRALTQSQEP
ncbi:MAG: hypothetical protein RH942_15075 [Kiloniellaceae bacterium]